MGVVQAQRQFLEACSPVERIAAGVEMTILTLARGGRHVEESPGEADDEAGADEGSGAQTLASG